MSLENELLVPDTRSDYCMASALEYLIIYGGQSIISSMVCKELWTHNTISGIWKRYQPPYEMTDYYLGCSICSVDNILYIFGGSDLRYGDQPTNSLISFNVCNAKWEMLSPHIDDYDENIPPPLIESCMFYHDGSLYILGGLHEDHFIHSIYKYSLNTSTWSVVNQNGQGPLLDGEVFGTVFKNQFYTFGDRAINRSNRFKTVYIFDLTTNMWTTKETKSTNQQYPDDRDDTSFAFSKKTGYLSGGISVEGFCTDIWKIDFVTLQWFKLDYILQTEMLFHQTAVVEDTYLYSFNADFKDFNYTYLLEKFILRPPTLYRQCLEKIARSLNLRAFIASLPPSIADDLIFDNHDPSLDI